MDIIFKTLFVKFKINSLQTADDDEDEEKYAEEMFMPGQKFDAKL